VGREHDLTPNTTVSLKREIVQNIPVDNLSQMLRFKSDLKIDTKCLKEFFGYNFNSETDQKKDYKPMKFMRNFSYQRIINLVCQSLITIQMWLRRLMDKKGLPRR
jgi:hypothetical protein